MNPVVLLVSAMIFIIVLVVSSRTLAGIDGLRDGRLPLSICIAILSVLGVVFGSSSSPGSRSAPVDEGPLSFILIPYAALGFALLFLLVLCCVGWFHRRVHRRNQRHERRDDRAPGRSSTPGRQARHRKVSGRESERG